MMTNKIFSLLALAASFGFFAPQVVSAQELIQQIDSENTANAPGEANLGLPPGPPVTNLVPILGATLGLAVIVGLSGGSSSTPSTPSTPSTTSP